MKTLTLNYDETLPFSLGETPAEFKKEARFPLMLKLFELGRISAGKAAQLFGMANPMFLLKASEQSVPVVRLNKDQLEAEFANA